MWGGGAGLGEGGGPNSLPACGKEEIIPACMNSKHPKHKSSQQGRLFSALTSVQTPTAPSAAKHLHHFPKTSPLQVKLIHQTLAPLKPSIFLSVIVVGCNCTGVSTPGVGRLNGEVRRTSQLTLTHSLTGFNLTKKRREWKLKSPLVGGGALIGGGGPRQARRHFHSFDVCLPRCAADAALCDPTPPDQ